MDAGGRDGGMHAHSAPVSRLQVFIRLRPDQSGRADAKVVSTESRIIQLTDPEGGRTSEFMFDRVLDGETTQEATFGAVVKYYTDPGCSKVCAGCDLVPIGPSRN